MKQRTLHYGLVIVALSMQLQAHDENVDHDIGNLHTYMWANYLQQAGDYPQAHHWYSRLLTHNPPSHVYKGYITLLAETEKFEELATLIGKLDAEFTHDAEIQTLFAQALYKTGKNQEADERFIRLSSRFKTDAAIIFQAANIYLQRKEPENALHVIENLLNNSPKKPNNFVFHFLKAQIYSQLNQTAKALQSIKFSLDLQPRFDKGWLMFALLHEQAGLLDEAMSGYARFLEISGNNREIMHHLTQLAFKQKMALSSKTNKPTHTGCLVKALTSFEQKNYDTALQHVDACLAIRPDDTESRLLKIQILSSKKEYDTAAQLLQTWLRKEPQQTTWYAALHLLCKTGLPYTRAIALIDTLAKEHPTASLPVLYLADWATRAQLYDKAIAYHKKALTLTHDDHIKTKLLFHMALMYHNLQQYEAMEASLEQGLKLGTQFPPLLNLLAYHYATHNKKLDTAQQLITQALKKSNNPHFLDTQALIWYQQKEYTKALSLLRSIATQAPHDISILRNLGKTHYQLGNFKEAVSAIKQAENKAQSTCDKEQCTSLLKSWERTIR